MLFEAVSRVSRGMGVLEGGGDRQRQFWRVNLKIVTNGTFATRSSQINLRTCLF